MSEAVKSLTCIFTKNIWQLFILVFLLQGCGLLLSIFAPNQYEGKVIKVADGDSITILYEGKELRIRLAEIDAPERGQPFWRKSREILADYVAGKEVTVEEFDVDQYGRVVGHVYLGDLWVNGELVRGGYAYVYPKYAVSKKLYEFEKDAQGNKAGIWKLPKKERIKPWVWRNNKNDR